MLTRTIVTPRSHCRPRQQQWLGRCLQITKAIIPTAPTLFRMRQALPPPHYGGTLVLHPALEQSPAITPFRSTPRTALRSTGLGLRKPLLRSIWASGVNRSCY